MASRLTVVAIVAGVIIAVAAIIFVLSPQKVGHSSIQTQLKGACKGSANCIIGTVTKVVDGDTLDIDNTRMRLALVNTPEVDEIGYAEAKDFTANLCPIGSQAVADEDDGQPGRSYGRVIAKVTCDGKILNEELLKAGKAQIFTDFCGRSEFSNEGWATSFGC